jgi:hypothetical protein
MIINVLSSLIVTAVVLTALLIVDAPNWALVGFGLVTYLNEAKYRPEGRE